MQFIFSGTMLRYTDYQKRVDCEATTVEDALGQLVARYPGLKNLLFGRTGEVRVTHRLFLNGSALSQNCLQQQLHGNDVVELLTAVAGG